MKTPEDAIRPAETDADIDRCAPVMMSLRPDLDPAAFVAQVRAMMAEGYRLAYIEHGGEITAVAGYRVLTMLSRGRFLYVDDLVTAPDARSKGHGGRLLEWLADEARRLGCERLHLDSGVQRIDAHRFYFNHRMHIACYHFARGL